MQILRAQLDVMTEFFQDAGVERVPPAQVAQERAKPGANSDQRIHTASPGFALSTALTASTRRFHPSSSSPSRRRPARVSR